MWKEISIAIITLRIFQMDASSLHITSLFDCWNDISKSDYRISYKVCDSPYFTFPMQEIAERKLELCFLLFSRENKLFYQVDVWLLQSNKENRKHKKTS